MTSFHHISDELNALISLWFRRGMKVKKRKILEPPNLNTEDPEDLVYQAYWEAYFNDSTRPVNLS
jgi:hypothetical protein